MRTRLHAYLTSLSPLLCISLYRPLPLAVTLPLSLTLPPSLSTTWGYPFLSLSHHSSLSLSLSLSLLALSPSLVTPLSLSSLYFSLYISLL